MANWYVGSTKYTAVAQWAALTTYSVGQIVRQLAAPTVGNERCFRASAITTGISGASEPAWTLTKGGTTSDTGVTWTEITGQAVFNGDGGGTAWAAPHARLANAFVSTWAAAGDNIYISNNHAETQTTSITISPPGTSASPNNVWCVVDTTVPPTATATTASITASNASISPGAAGAAYYYGISFISSGTSNTQIQIGVANTTASTSIFDACVFNLSSTNTSSQYSLRGGGGATYLKFNNCTLLFGNASQLIQIFSPLAEFTGCTFANSGSVPTSLFVGASFNTCSGVVNLKSCDLSGVTTALVSASAQNMQAYYLFSNCKLGSGVSPLSGSNNGKGGAVVKLDNCDSANTNYTLYANDGYTGSIQQETTIVRTGGATNGTTPISYKIVTASTCTTAVPYISTWPFGHEITVWNTNASGAQTATIFLTSNTALTNATFWAEAEYLGTSGFPLGLVVTSKVALLGSAAALTTDSSTWGGSITNKYKIVLSFTPTEVGVLKIRLGCASASTTVYVDPEVVISNQTSGRQYIIPGGTFHNDASSSGGSSSMLVHPGLIGGMHG